MKKITTKITSFFSALGLSTLIFLFTVTLAVAQPSEVWIDNDYCNGCSNDGHTWDYNAFDNIQEGIDAVASPGTVYVAAGLYEGKVVLKTQVSLLGAGIGVSIIDGMGLKEGVEDTVVAMASGSKISGFSIINGGWNGVECRGVSAIIEGNWVAHHDSIGIHLIGYGSRNSIVSNNIVADVRAQGIFGNSIVGSPQILHNTVLGNTDGIGFWYRGTPIIKNNIVVNNKENGIIVGGNLTSGIAEPLYSHNNAWNNKFNWNNLEPGEGAISENPLFVNEIDGDYRLQKDSPCIDTGTDVGVYVDLEGDVRPQGLGYDMGADEFMPQYIEVVIDIKPGGYPNSINPRSKGKIPVAILSSIDFDAPTEVDTESLTFGPTGDEKSLAFCSPSSEDVNDDGYDDIVCNFYTQMTEFECGDKEGILKGQTVDETPLEGNDSVRIVPSACR